MKIERLTRVGKVYFPSVCLTLLVVLMSIAAYPVFGQLRVVPIAPSPEAVASTLPATQARTQQVAPLNLPFWDDFSRPYLQAFPDTSLWEVNYTVWVNDGMAIRPLTMYVATFDGLDSAARAFNPNETGVSGYTDSLVSRPIDLTTEADNPVPENERNTVYLSFYYQLKGHGEAPDPGDDFLDVDFLDENGAWVNVWRIEPDNSLSESMFYPVVVPVSDASFFHAHFRFRIRSYGRRTGPFDTWHVDYVYLNKGRNANDLSFPDRAISTPLGPLFGRYYAIPRRHLLSDEQFTPPRFAVQNMKNTLATLNFRTEAEFHHTAAGNTTVFHAALKDSTAINITNGILLAKEHKVIRLDTVPTLTSPLHFPPDADSTLIRFTVTLKTGDNVPVNPGGPGDYTPNYEPILFTANDTVRTDYVLSGYYAYDDGVAEYAAELLESGNLAAVAFDLPLNDTFTQDTLVGFDIYFPPHGVSTNQTIDFTIYHDDGNGMPGEVWLSVPARRVQPGGRGQFRRFAFLPAILIDEPRFHIGWRAPVEGRAQVGLDRGNDTGDLIHVNTNGTWLPNTSVTGTLMIRPVFGHGEVGDEVGVEVPPAFSVYPNPSTGRIIIEGPANDVQVLAMTGAGVPCQVSTDRNITVVEIHQPAGVYILRYRQDSLIRTVKIVIKEY